MKRGEKRKNKINRRGERKEESHRGTLLDFVAGMIPTLAKQVPNIVQASHRFNGLTV